MRSGLSGVVVAWRAGRHCSRWLGSFVCVLGLMMAFHAARGADFRTPLLATAPVIDGVIQADEWKTSTQFDWLGYGGTLNRRHCRAYIGATASAIYVAIRSQTPDEGKLLADQFLMDPGHGVYDDSLEVYITPDPDAKEVVTYQFLENPNGIGGYQVLRGGATDYDDGWNGKWKFSNSVHDGWWDFECMIPLSSIPSAATRPITKGEWLLNVTRNWKNPWEWTSLAGGYSGGGSRFIFGDNTAPAVRTASSSDPFLGNFQETLTLTNAGQQPIAVKAAIEVSSPEKAVLRKEQTFPALGAGETQNLLLDVPGDTVTKYTMKISVTSLDGKTVYYERETSWPREKAPYRWVAPMTNPQLLQPVAPAANEVFFGGHMQRTMSLLATSNPERHNPVHIVIYGQSITGGGWWRAFVDDLKARYPYADLKVENLSIGGIGTETLIRTAIFDVYPSYPDLIIFQAYGGENGELDQLIANIRRYTTADVLLFTHHIMNPPNMTNGDWEHAGQTISQDRMADGIRFIAQKYGCELVEVREEWRQYLKQYGLPASEIVSGDGVHPNVVGNDLLAVLVGRHFRFNPIISELWAARVRGYQLLNPLIEGVKDEISFQGDSWKVDGLLGIGSSPQSTLKLTFEGNRVDIITAPVTDKQLKLGTAKILIDGKAPSADPNLYVFTRPDATPGSWFPAVLHLEHNTALIPETWTMRITDISKDGKNVAFDISGSITGPDGSGTNAARFVSKSGRIIIEPKDLERIGWSHVNMAPCPIGHEFKWKVIPQFIDTYTPPAATNNTRVYAVTVAQGLVNTRHTLEIIPNGDGAVPIQSIQIFCPTLK